MDLDLVYRSWAEDLATYSLGAINYGIEVAKRDQHPPSLGEFIVKCQGYKPADAMRLEHRLTPEQLEVNRKRVQALIQALVNGKVLA